MNIVVKLPPQLNRKIPPQNTPLTPKPENTKIALTINMPRWTKVRADLKVLTSIAVNNDSSVAIQIPPPNHSEGKPFSLHFLTHDILSYIC